MGGDGTVPDDVVIGTVPSLLRYGDARKREGRYPVTAGEVRRRAGPPENMSATGLKQYLRVGKSNTELLPALSDLLPPVKGKTQFSPLAKLCEAEGAEVVRGLEAAILGQFPIQRVAAGMVADTPT